MARNILGNVKMAEPGGKRIEFKPAENRDIGLELFNMYILLKKDGAKNNDKPDFESVVGTLESVISVAKDQLEPQPVINSLTNMLKDESDGEDFSRTMYLTAVVQALFNLNHADKFVIDVREWAKGDYIIGSFLHGTPDKHLTLELYGNFRWCGWRAENSNFTLYGNVKLCGWGAENSNFTLYGKVEWCGLGAENCTFDQMPDAKIEKYGASKSKGNRLRRLNEKGEVMFLPTLRLNLKFFDSWL